MPVLVVSSARVQKKPWMLWNTDREVAKVHVLLVVPCRFVCFPIGVEYPVEMIEMLLYLKNLQLRIQLTQPSASMHFHLVLAAARFT